MDILTRDTLKTLLASNRDPHVSLYLPTHRGGVQAREDVIRLKNLLRQAEEQLEALGVRGVQARELLAPARLLLEDKPFWQSQGEGLAIFLGPGTFRYFRLPLRFEQLAVVADHFHVRPLLALLTEDGRFFLLTLSKKEIRLHQCTRQSHREIELRDVPTSFDEFLRFDVSEKHLQVSGGSGPKGHTGGRGGGPDEAIEKSKLLDYLRHVDTAVRKALRDAREPLVLASVEYLRGLYKEANHYPALLPEGIDGNPEGRSIDELHRLACTLVEPRFTKARGDAVSQFRQFHGTDRASKDLSAVVSAAYAGRVGLLLIAAGTHCWGSFDPATLNVELHPHEQPGDKELLDFVATHTLLHGGAVHAVGPEHLPADSPLAAVFRH